jgi:hypothetical protein
MQRVEFFESLAHHVQVYARLKAKYNGSAGREVEWKGTTTIVVIDRGKVAVTARSRVIPAQH